MEATPSLIDETLAQDPPAQSSGAVISIEFVAYALLLLLAFVLRFAQLDAIPLTNAEARQALAAWRVVQPDAVGSAIVPESPLLFMLHSLSFTLLGGSEFAVRSWTALGGIALILTPLLFRGLLGRGRAFILSVLLTFSPVLLVASRTDSAVVWTVLAGVLALWALWRYFDTAQSRYTVFATVLILTAALLTDPTGFVLIFILGGAGLLAFWITPRESLDETPSPSATIASIARERWQTWPWQSGLLVAAIVVALVSTLFMLYPAGLSAVSGLLGAFVGGLTTPRPDAPFMFPIVISLFYDPVMVVMGLTAIIWLLRKDALTFVERFLIGWLIFGVLASVAYAGTGPEHALWIVLPLTGLASSLVVGMLARSEHPLWWDVPAWSKWVVMLISVALLGMFALHVQAFARALVNSPEGSFQLLNSNTASVVWVIISLLFMVIGFFLASSIWGLDSTLQGAALGLLVFGLVTSLGSGWRAAVVTADNPVELWNREPVSKDVFLLRQALYEVADRQTNGFPKIPVMALVPDDGVIAWELRDFVNVRYISNVADARTQEIALLPEMNEPPDLGGSYVGSRFDVVANWSPQSVQFADLLAWWLQRKTRLQSDPVDTLVLWLRQDVYNGVPYQPQIGG
ncbi:MAG: glycosyltransferase family 39 protein [Anaerolineae bacterium]|nr:glycosyltransferase family 39 protein [Anaerolineae bacterium]